MDAIWHTPMVPYGTLHWCHMAHTINVNLLKNLTFSMIFRHSDGAIWHTPLVPYGTHDRCHMATGTLGVCHYGGTWCPSVAGGGGEFFVSENPQQSPARALKARVATRGSRRGCQADAHLGGKKQTRTRTYKLRQDFTCWHHWWQYWWQYCPTQNRKMRQLSHNLKIGPRTGCATLHIR